MRTWLRWLLAATVLSSVLALWWHETVSLPVAGAGSKATEGATASTGHSPAGESAAASVRALPSRLTSVTLDAANFDPFVGVVPPPPPPPPPQVVAPPPPPPPPAPPPFNYRYLGRMLDPSGNELVYLANAARTVPVTVGTRLDEGYVVESIGLESITFHYPALDTRTVISIPPARNISSAP